ncbi:MAG: energy transducer TonB [Sphingobium sp.]
MTTFANIRIAALTAISAFALAGTAVSAQAATQNAPLTLADWHAQAEKQIDAKMRVPADMTAGDVRTARVAISFDATGHATGSRLIQSSGFTGTDAEAQRVARRVSFPQLPVALQGKPRTVEMELYFGTEQNRAEVAEALAERHDQMGAVIRKVDTRIRQVENGSALPTG